MSSFANIHQPAPDYLGIENLENIAQQLKENSTGAWAIACFGERLYSSLPPQYQQQNYE